LKIVEWNEYTSLLDKLYDSIQLRSFDGIVAIGRGGCIIGAYLASKLGLPTFYPVFVRHVGRGPNMRIVAHDTISMFLERLARTHSVQGNFLIVDDWLAEGRAMKFVLDRIPRGASVTTMVMFNRKGSEFKPDYVGAYVEEEERDIMFPYDALG
jgi:adenine/guanine phosphoribosyltransferase-like PRPP-binding protein